MGGGGGCCRKMWYYNPRYLSSIILIRRADKISYYAAARGGGGGEPHYTFQRKLFLSPIRSNLIGSYRTKKKNQKLQPVQEDSHDEGLTAVEDASESGKIAGNDDSEYLFLRS